MSKKYNIPTSEVRTTPVDRDQANVVLAAIDSIPSASYSPTTEDANDFISLPEFPHIKSQQTVMIDEFDLEDVFSDEELDFLEDIEY